MPKLLPEFVEGKTEPIESQRRNLFNANLYIQNNALL